MLRASNAQLGEIITDKENKVCARSVGKPDSYLWMLIPTRERFLVGNHDNSWTHPTPNPPDQG